ncbi:EAL domain-containing protein [Alkalicoccobacillus murimartini]|uniref:EAL domain-containing protein (Putative c-di-GMP-specific phosphodiesterase class I) n=1 Tax=Alkalicoccobacillus murimartini TaxID=171685 RepID=A0ABT9YEQ8_9BACI|nr:EAL-associated domain-containing protein [Alkalicoccobacillus murimartini]MDQ0206214.1 EAL domain-containing protein (putative c-di-GMP-specific phosphodiesterase class I) [Alkalicoccobacillus murimartini]
MDPLDIMMDKEHVIPYFLPIFSAEKQVVVGYEVVARLVTPEGVKRLGWFFSDKSIPSEYRNELDDHLQKLALDQYSATGFKGAIYFNYDARQLVKDAGESLLNRIEPYILEQSITYNQIIIGLNEKDVHSYYKEIKHVLTYFQSLGIRIGIDNFGQSSSQLDQIALTNPNVIRVNVSFLDQDSLPHLYGDVHQSLTMLSRKIGATLLFDGITTFNQLNYAWRNGARYYQGPYLKTSAKEMISEDACKDRMQKDFHHFITYERRKVQAQLDLSNELSLALRATMKQIKPHTPLDNMIIDIAKNLNQYVFRIYVCNEEGFQQTANAEKDDSGNWLLKMEGLHKNWSWRPYFLENIVRMDVEKKGILSDLYTDIERDEQIRTFAYPISDSLYMFMDIPYEYLFDQDDLL